MRSLRILFFLASLLLGPAAHCLEYSLNGDLTLFRGFRNLRENNASDYVSVDDSVGVFGLGTKIQIPSWTLDVKGRVIASYGPGLGVDPTDPAYLDMGSPPRFLSWQSQVQRSSNTQVLTDFEKAYLMFQKGNFEFSAGRRAVGIGTLKYLPIWNRFVPTIAHIGGPALIYNPDDVQASYQFKKYAISGIHIEGATPDDNISILMNTWYLDWIEIHALAAYWWQRETAGVAFTKDFEGLTLRGESLFFQDQTDKNKVQGQGGLGIEYAFSPKFSIVTEAMYSSIGANSISQYSTAVPDKFALLNADGYVFAILEYMPFDFWKFSLGSLVNLVDSSFLGLAEIKYSWSENLDLSLQLKQPVGKDGQEFGSDFYRVTEDINFGYSQQLAGQLNYYF